MGKKGADNVLKMEINLNWSKVFSRLKTSCKQCLFLIQNRLCHWPKSNWMIKCLCYYHSVAMLATNKLLYPIRVVMITCDIATLTTHRFYLISYSKGWIWLVMSGLSSLKGLKMDCQLSINRCIIICPSPTVTNGILWYGRCSLSYDQNHQQL